MRPARLISFAISTAAMVRPTTSRSGSMGNIGRPLTRANDREESNRSFRRRLARGIAPVRALAKGRTRCAHDPDRQWILPSPRGYIGRVLAIPCRPGAPLNPTEPLVRELARRRHPGDVRRVAHVCRVNYEAVDRELPALLEREAPDALVMFGLAGRTKHV